MAILTNNILTITEPTIELDPFEIADIESGNSGEDVEQRDKRKDNLSKFVGDTYPAIRINKFDFNRSDVKAFRLRIEEFLPKLTVSVVDTRGVFTLSQYPTDGDVLSLFIRSKDEEVYKPIRMDFDIIDIQSNPVSNIDQTTPRDSDVNPIAEVQVFTFECQAKIPNLLAESNQSYSSDSLFNHLEQVASELGLGFASNVTATNDVMTRICAFDSKRKFIEDHTATAYLDDNSFFNSYIDQYYYLNFVNINNQFNFDQSLEDTLRTAIEDPTIDRNFDEGNIVNSKLFLTNLDKGSLGMSNYIRKYALINNSGRVFLKNGYKRVAQYYDEDDKEFRDFTIDPLTSADLPEDLFPLKGRPDEDLFETQIKYKYLGKQSSVAAEGNTHLNYQFAKLHNFQNFEDYKKLMLLVELPVANMALYKYQRIPVIIYETQPIRIETLNQREQRNRDDGQRTPKDKRGDRADSIDQRHGAPKLNEFLTGLYVIDKIEYFYRRFDETIKQRLWLARREWPARI